MTYWIKGGPDTATVVTLEGFSEIRECDQSRELFQR